HRVCVPLATGELRAVTSSGTVRLASLGTLDERLQLAEVMRTQLGLEDVDDGYQPTVPEGWEEIIDPEGGVSLVRDPKIRVTQSRVAGALAAVAALLAVFLGRSALENLDLLPITAVVSAVAFGLGWITLVLARARTEWRFEPGRLVLRRRFGRRVRELFTATALELSPRRDGDGDPWYVLEAVAAEHGLTGPRAGRKHRRRITYAVNDPTEPRRLGRRDRPAGARRLARPPRRAPPPPREVRPPAMASREEWRRGDTGPSHPREEQNAKAQGRKAPHPAMEKMKRRDAGPQSPHPSDKPTRSRRVRVGLPRQCGSRRLRLDL
ncbi:MAG: hypothetical protein P8Y02_15780, partial [Deinococcales bacterium]